jgi:hypothetical protein
MPYPNAHFYVLGLILATVLGFWPTYFSVLGTSPGALHFHGITATLWMLVLAAQSRSIHNRRVLLHRQVGRLSLGLFPLFLAGFFLVFQSESRKALGGDPFETIVGPGIGVVTIVAVVTIAYLFHGALKYRKSAQLHGRYLVSIPFMFAESVFSRIFNRYVPGLIVRGPEDVNLFYWAIHFSEVIAIGIALYLYTRAPRHGRPFLVVSFAMFLQSLSIETVEQVAWWREVYLAVADIPVVLMLSIGLATGALVAWFGWMGGGRPSSSVAPARAEPQPRLLNSP